MEEQEIELIDYLNVIWKRKGLIIGGTLVVAAAALVVSLLMPKIYEASVTLLVTESKIPSAAGPPVRTGISPETFYPMIRNHSIAEKALDKFNLNAEPHNLRPGGILSTVSVNTSRGTNLITLRVAFSDPELAKEIANFVAEEAVRNNTALNRADTVTTREFIRRERDVAADVLKTSEEALTEFKGTANLEALRADQGILIAEKGSLRGALSGVTTELVATRAKVAQLREGLKGQQQTLILTKSILTDPPLLAAAQDGGVSGLKNLSTIYLKSEEINRVYESLLSNLITSKTRIAELESKHVELQRKLAVSVEKLRSVEAAVAKKEGKLENLTRRYTLAKDTYQLFAKKFEEAALLVASRVNDLKIVDRAVIPQGPVKPRVKLNVALGGTLGLMMFTFLAFFLEYLQNVRKGGRQK